jgi:AcrR family transcriptional regulator
MQPKIKARRGEQLREHILWAAKDVFLEMGFERASMDVVANRAETSKRSLYAHFESKEKLFLAVIEMVRGLLLGRLSSPYAYSEKPAEALALFCARYLEILVFSGSIRMCRVSVAESERFPEQAKLYFDVLFTQVQSLLGAYLKSVFGMSVRASADAAQRLLGQVLYPLFPRALFGVDGLVESIEDDPVPSNVDLKWIRKSVAELLQSIDPH